MERFTEAEAFALAEMAKSNTPPKISAFLEEVKETSRADLANKADVVDVDHIPSLDEMFVDKRTWLRIRPVVAVAADLKNSTALSTKDKYVNTSARLYEAATGSGVKMLSKFEPGFMDIQGDGMFALFHGELAFERAFCAAVTVKTFSARHLAPMIEELFSETFPDTGFKVGMASGTLAVKKVGVRGTNEPVWVGKPVNWAWKCAEKADAHELVATSAVYQKLEQNDYIAWSCGCPSGVPTSLWGDTEVEKLGKHAQSKLLLSNWCPTHGDDFCQAILDGDQNRDDVPRQAAA